MSKSGRNSLLDVREWTGGPLECPGVVGRPSQMSGNDRDALPGCLAVVRRPSRMSESGWVDFPDFQEWSEDPPGCPGVFVRPSRLSGSGRDALPDVRK